MKLLNLLSKGRQKKDPFSGFFINASDKKKNQVFTEAAKRANQDQRDLIKKIDKLQKAT